MAPPLQSLPFDVIFHIVTYLPLNCALHFATTCCIAFDAVHYHFAHLNVLDFASCLNHSSIINLPDEELLAVLHAHTRAVCIRNFAPSPTFQKHSELAKYFTTYLHTGFNGHPQGQLLYIHFPTEYQINPLTKHMYHEICGILDRHDKWGIVTDPDHSSNIQMEWSDVDLDAPPTDHEPVYYEDWFSELSDRQYWETKLTSHAWRTPKPLPPLPPMPLPWSYTDDN